MTMLSLSCRAKYAWRPTRRPLFLPCAPTDTAVIHLQTSSYLILEYAHVHISCEVSLLYIAHVSPPPSLSSSLAPCLSHHAGQPHR